MYIITSRLLLRDFTPPDVIAVHAFDSDPELARYRGGGRVTETDTHAFFQRTQSWQQSDSNTSVDLIPLKGMEEWLFEQLFLTSAESWKSRLTSD